MSLADIGLKIDVQNVEAAVAAHPPEDAGIDLLHVDIEPLTGR